MNLAIWASVVTALTTTALSIAASVASATGLAIGSSINSKNVPPGTTLGTLSGTNGNLSIPAITLPGKTNINAERITDLPLTAGLLGAAVTGPGIPAGVTVLAITQAAIPATNLSEGTKGIVQISAFPTLTTPDKNNPGQFTFARTANAILTSGADNAASFTGAGVVFNGTLQLERSFDGGSTWLVCNVGSGGTLAQYSAGTPVNLTFGEPEKNVLYRLNCIAYVSGNINYRISQTGGAAESLAIGPLSGG